MINFLVVDDDPDVTELIQNILINNYPDCIVDVCYDGKEATNLCQKNRYDIVMTDLKMPVLSGNEFISRLRQDSKNYQDTPIIVISGFLDHQLQAESVSNTFYIQKPFFSNKLITTTNLALLP